MISERLKAVIFRELKLSPIEVLDDTTADQIPGWDSLSHLRILAAVEDEFHVKFKGMEVMRLKKIGDLQALIEKKAAEK